MFVIVSKAKQTQKQFIALTVDPASIDATKKQFTVVAATETPVFRRGWEENFFEILSCNKDNMRTQRMDNGVCPLMDNHDTWTGVTKQYGVVTSYSIDKNEVRATLQFSADPAHEGVWKNIEAGIIRGISARYIPWVYTREIVTDRPEPNYRAIDWEITEISLAPVPADYNSMVRSAQTNEPSFEVEIKNFNNETNTRSNMEPVKKVEEQAPAATVVVTPGATEQRAATVVDEAKLRTEATAAEQKRSLEIRTEVRRVKLEETFADELIAGNSTIEQARTLIIDKLATTDATAGIRAVNTGASSASGDEMDGVLRSMGDALLHRATPGSVKLEGKAHDFKYMSMLDMARACLALKGDTARYSPNETVKRAIATSDYPILLNQTLERSIRKVYDILPVEWKQIARQTTAKDFRTKTGIAIDGKVTFEEIAEGGDYKNSVLITDDTAQIKLKTYGRKITISRQAIINDDLGVFDKLPGLVARGANNFQAAAVWALITGNKKTPDGKAIFHTDHGNLAGAGTTITEAALTAARTAMWRQTSPAGEPLPITPKFLIVPIELQTAAEKLMTSVASIATGDVNVFANKYGIISSPYLTSASQWYLCGDPSILEGLVYAYLEGEDGLFIDKEIDFNNDCVVTKARLDFACANWDYRGWYKNPGA